MDLKVSLFHVTPHLTAWNHTLTGTQINNRKRNLKDKRGSMILPSPNAKLTIGAKEVAPPVTSST